MCQDCDYKEILSLAGLEATTNRLHVLEVIGASGYPLSAGDIFTTVQRRHPINRVTVYRILDLFAGKNIIERLSSGKRGSYYGLAPNENHAPHPHFYCTRCHQMDCLSPESLAVNTENLRNTFPGEIERVEVRVDGLCKNCLKQKGRQ